MKNKLLKIVQLIQENQNGLFKIAILLILIYWTCIFKNIANNYVDLSGVQDELSNIASKLDGIESTLIMK